MPRPYRRTLPISSYRRAPAAPHAEWHGYRQHRPPCQRVRPCPRQADERSRQGRPGSPRSRPSGWWAGAAHRRSVQRLRAVSTVSRYRSGHGEYSGRYCPTCRDARLAAKREGRTIPKRSPGEPDALVVDDGWRERAACRYPIPGLDADAWFAMRSTLVGRAAVEKARAVCEGCPVREACLAYAVATWQPWGIWGGQTADERGTAYHRV